MNILVLASEYPYEQDKNADRTKVVGYFAREWLKQGHKVIVIVNSSRFPKVYYEIGNIFTGFITKVFGVSKIPSSLWTVRFSYNDNGVNVENVPIIKYIPHGKFSQKVINNQLNIIYTILKENEFIPDVVTGHWVNPQVMLVPQVARKYNAKSAFVFHADYRKEICEKFNVQKYIDKIDHIGFRSQSALNSAEKYLKFKKAPFIAASGIPDEFISKFNNEKIKSFDEPISIMSAARLVEYKKVDRALMAAIKAFKGVDYNFVVAGDGPMKIKLQKLINKMNQNNRIKLLGQIARNDLQKIMRERQIFVLISKHETFGLVYLEAMLQGCIVIASRYGGVDGIIKDGENGFLCEEGNEEELIQIFKTIKKMTQEEKEKISYSAVETAKHFTEFRVARHYLENITG